MLDYLTKIVNKVANKFNILKLKLVSFKYKVMYSNRINIGEKVSFRNNFNILIELDGYVKIGKNCFFNNDCSINCLGKIEIGDDSIFGENVKLYDHNHIYTDKNHLVRKQGFSIGTICIGSNCWIGSNVTILNNVVIGDNVVIGANCLIYKSIPSNTIVKNKSDLIIIDHD